MRSSVPFHPRATTDGHTVHPHGDRYFLGAIRHSRSQRKISRSAPWSHASQTRSRRKRRTIPCAARGVRADKNLQQPSFPTAVSHTVHRQIARMLPPQPCVRSDRRTDLAPLVSKEAGNFEQGVE